MTTKSYNSAVGLKARIPRPWRRRLKFAPYIVGVVSKMVGGSQTRECPVCGYTGPFAAAGNPPRYDAECKKCGSAERHRLLKLAIERLDLLNGVRDIVHFAPEPMVTRFLPKEGYKTADIRPQRADLCLNLESIELPERSVDMVVANHVLEHVDDSKALPELFRILRPGGALIATIPIVEGWDHTYEDPTVTSAKDRTLHFGQFDHVRIYGRDFRDRVKAAGFELTEFTVSGAEYLRYAMLPGERVFIARRPALAAGEP